MSVETLQQEFLKLPKAEQMFFGRFPEVSPSNRDRLGEVVVENIFSNIEESVLTEEQKIQVEAQYELYKQGKLKLIPLAQFRENVKKTHGI